MILSKTFNLSVGHMLHTCQLIMHFFFLTKCAAAIRIMSLLLLYRYFFNHCSRCLDDDPWPLCVILVSSSHYFYKGNCFDRQLLIEVELTKVCGMSKTESFSLQDTRHIIKEIKHKCKQSNGETEFVYVDEYLTSQIYNKCRANQLNNISITGSKRRVCSVSKCEFYGTVQNRDVNSALNIYSIFVYKSKYANDRPTKD